MYGLMDALWTAGKWALRIAAVAAVAGLVYWLT